MTGVQPKVFRTLVSAADQGQSAGGGRAQPGPRPQIPRQRKLREHIVRGRLQRLDPDRIDPKILAHQLSHTRHPQAVTQACEHHLAGKIGHIHVGRRRCG